METKVNLNRLSGFFGSVIRIIKRFYNSHLTELKKSCKLNLLLKLFKGACNLKLHHMASRQSVCRNVKDLYGNILRFIFKSKYWVEYINPE